MMAPSSKVMRHGLESFTMGEVVFAKHPESGVPTLAKITGNLGRGKFSVVYFKDPETEFIALPAQHLFEACKNVDFTQGDELDEKIENRCKVKFENLDNEFDASFYHLKPALCPGDACFALWGRTRAFIPAVVKESEDMYTYSIQFKGIDKCFPARADNIIAVKTFDEDEKVFAFWARDGKYYPATVKEIVDEYTVKIQFDKLDKLFEMPTYQIRYDDRDV